MSESGGPSRFGVILVAAGRSTRFGDEHYKKPFAPLADRAVWLHSAERFLARDDVARVVIVIAEEDREGFQRKFGANLAFMNVALAIGGETRTDSVRSGLAAVGDGVSHVAVHDAARPCVTDAAIDAVFAKAVETGAAILAAPVAATLKRVDGGSISETVSREGVWAAQTPQVFERGLIDRAYEADASATDDAELVQRLGQAVAVVEGPADNLKITSKADLRLAEQILKSRPRPKPDGAGHPFADDDLWR